jgi:hypothetical protein
MFYFRITRNCAASHVMGKKSTWIYFIQQVFMHLLLK